MTKLVVLVFGLLSPVLCSAQDAQTLSLKQSLKLAFEHNPDIVAARLNEQRAEIGERSSFGRFLPSCNSRLNCTVQDKPQTSLSGIQGLVRTRESHSFNLSASWVLFSGFGGLAAHAGQRHVTEARKLIHQRTKEEVALSVTQRYLACLRASQLVNISRKAVERSRTHLEQTEAMLHVGAVPKADVMKQKVQLADARLALVRSRMEWGPALTDLLSLVGADGVPADVRLEDVTADTTDERIPFEQALKSAIAHRKDLASERCFPEAASQQCRAARSALLPSLAATASYGFWDVVFPRSLNEFDRIDTVSYDLTLGIPIFNRLQTRGQLDRARIALRQSQEQQKSLRRQIPLEVRDALNDISGAKESIAAARENVKAAREDLSVAEENYRLGSAGVLDRITASVQLAEAEANHMNALYDFALAKAKLRSVMGWSPAPSDAMNGRPDG